MQMTDLLDLSIQLELSISRLYARFARDFPDDMGLWSKLAIEENNHAAILRSAKESFLDMNLFPEDMVCSQLQCLKKIRKSIPEWIKEYSSEAPDRASALRYALQLETSAGELHYQNTMAGNDDCTASQLFKRLNGTDKDHADRLRAYMKSSGIK